MVQNGLKKKAATSIGAVKASVRVQHPASIGKDRLENCNQKSARLCAKSPIAPASKGLVRAITQLGKIIGGLVISRLDDKILNDLGKSLSGGGPCACDCAEFFRRRFLRAAAERT